MRTTQEPDLQTGVGFLFTVKVCVLCTDAVVFRYLAANAAVPRYLDPDISGSMAAVLHRTAMQPASLRKSHLYVTPSRKASMLKSGRGVAAVSSSCYTPSKASSTVPTPCACIILEDSFVLVPLWEFCGRSTT
jgi:hypothetical protein